MYEEEWNVITWSEYEEERSEYDNEDTMYVCMYVDREYKEYVVYSIKSIRYNIESMYVNRY